MLIQGYLNLLSLIGNDVCNFFLISRKHTSTFSSTVAVIVVVLLCCRRKKEQDKYNEKENDKK